MFKIITEQDVLDYAERLTAKAHWIDTLVSHPWCVQCHTVMFKAGKDRKGGQRWICGACDVR